VINKFIRAFKGWAILNLRLFGSRFFNKKNIPPQLPITTNPEYSKMLLGLMNFKVPLISVENLHRKINKVHIFDTRSKAEFEVSHLPHALYLGFEEFDQTLLSEIPKNAELVLYCSVGYRSEQIGEKLIQLGFFNTYNLYGGIFEWANQRLPLANATEQPTHCVHTYNQAWSKWVDNKALKKTW
jgi:rhodanese-related sulfurtransferase